MKTRDLKFGLAVADSQWSREPVYVVMPDVRELRLNLEPGELPRVVRYYEGTVGIARLDHDGTWTPTVIRPRDLLRPWSEEVKRRGEGRRMAQERVAREKRERSDAARALWALRKLGIRKARTGQYDNTELRVSVQSILAALEEAGQK